MFLSCLNKKVNYTENVVKLLKIKTFSPVQKAHILKLNCKTDSYFCQNEIQFAKMLFIIDGAIKTMLNFTLNLQPTCERSKAPFLNSYIKGLFIIKSKWLSCKKTSSLILKVKETVEDKWTVFVHFQLVSVCFPNLGYRHVKGFEFT